MSASTLGMSSRLHSIPVAITSSFESYVPKTRLAPYEAAVAIANGLGPDRALQAITLDAARFLKIDRE